MMYVLWFILASAACMMLGAAYSLAAIATRRAWGTTGLVLFTAAVCVLLVAAPWAALLGFGLLDLAIFPLCAGAVAATVTVERRMGRPKDVSAFPLAASGALVFGLTSMVPMTFLMALAINHPG